MCTNYCLMDSDGTYSKRRAWQNTLDRVVLDIDSSLTLMAIINGKVDG